MKTALFDKQKEEYVKAKARLEQYELANGLKDENGDYIIEPLPVGVVNTDGEYVRNPLIIRDEAERLIAREVIDKIPQAVIDSINT